MGMALVAVSCRGDGHGGSFGPFSGELGYARFDWTCTGSGDLACEPDYEDVLPQRLALGSRFDLSFGLVDGVPRELSAGYLVLASPVGVRASSFDYEVTAEGRVTLLALTSGGEVADFLRFEVRAIDALQITHDCDVLYDDGDTSDCGRTVSSVQPLGDTLQLRVEPYGGGSALMGDLDYQWEVSPPERIALVDERGNGAEVDLLAPGPALVVVRH
ncbi:MAG: hypothetical protein KDK70_40265, partial [Myxococcales bacterium]|nr:hypothetical protein [Myxococcales bacterium]